MSEIVHLKLPEIIDQQAAMRNQSEFMADTAKKSEQSPEAWEWENCWLAEGLRTHMADLEVEDVVGQFRAQLHRLSGFDDTQMRFRNFGWVPDDTLRTHESYPRLRAIWMNGVHLYLPAQQYPYEQSVVGMFYTGAVALEEPGGIDFRYFTSGQDDDCKYVKSPANWVYGTVTWGVFEALDGLQDKDAFERNYEGIRSSCIFGLFPFLMEGQVFETVAELRKVAQSTYGSLDERQQAYAGAATGVRAELARRPIPTLQRNTLLSDNTSQYMQQLVSPPTAENPYTLGADSRPLIPENRAIDKAQIAADFDVFLRNSNYLSRLIACS